MFQVRFHGRGGQGVVTAAELLSVAAFNQGRHAQAFPDFGPERTGAPVASFCRIDAQPIRLREPVFDADAVVVQDPTLVRAVDVFRGLRLDGFVLLNSARGFDSLGLAALERRLLPGHARAIPAGEIARVHVGRPLPGAAMLGALAALTGAVELEPLLAAIRARFAPAVAEGNVAAAREAFAVVRDGGIAVGRAAC